MVCESEVEAVVRMLSKCKVSVGYCEAKKSQSQHQSHTVYLHSGKASIKKGEEFPGCMYVSNASTITITQCLLA